MFVYFNGRKLPVDDSSLDYDKDFIPNASKAVVVCGDAEDELVHGYLLSIQSCPSPQDRFEPQDIIREKYFTEYPTDNQIIEELSKSDNIHGIAVIHECWSLV